eukprot:CAMPEP_0202494322 /NCGR_PEP_ID=MMETSP1361-20130828/11103_1 /ASSEMBLY_ACC=CAM_ASM_000849 /TAXON_ID=210615 /ORGANISM="Staurosira complex sp., Strain CCMP2646" /LENGTH=210 /DNA_ID=CAMNT_0049124759 /DNA_START=8 /DNA_END=640 /DNA_ORIENTATION=+
MMAPPPKEAKSKDNEEKANSMSESIENMPDGPKLAQSRSEKKRSREQQRRNQVNEGLDKLTDLIFIIDPDLKAAAKTRAVNNNKSNVKDNQLLSRVELVDTAVATLTRVHQENEVNKMIVARLTAGNPGMLALAMGLPGMGGNSVAYPSLGNQHLSRESEAVAGLGAMAASSPSNTGSPESKTNDGDSNDAKKEDGPPTKRLKKRQQKKD